MNENKKVPNHNTKKDKITTIIIVALIIFSGIYLFWDNFMGVQPDIKINDTQISMRNTVQDLLDKGFVLCDKNGSVKDPLEMTLTTRQIYNTDYYIGVPRESGGSFCKPSGVAITVANFGSSSAKFKDCSIYEMTYYPHNQDIYVNVLVNGEDLREASIDDWLDFFEKVGYPFKKEDLDKFRRGDRESLYGKRGRYKFDVDTSSIYSEREIFSLTFTRNVEVTHTSR